MFTLSSVLGNGPNVLGRDFLIIFLNLEDVEYYVTYYNDILKVLV